MRIVKYVLAVIGLLVVALAAVLVVNTLRYRPAPVTGVEPYSLGVDAEAAAGTLARAVQFRTVSDDLSRPDFPAFLAFLDETFPGVTAATEKVVLEANTPLYKWQGSDDSLPPVLLAAHYDVVPIPPGSLERWDYDPFAGEIADGYVWGRGTLDNKGALVALLTNWHLPEIWLTAYYPPYDTLPAKVSAFSGFVEESVLGDPDLLC